MEDSRKEKMEHHWLIKLLYKLVDQVKGIRYEKLDRVIEQHPVTEKAYDMGKRFKETLFVQKLDRRTR